ncbi:DNA topoisomerase 2 isoform X1 [Arachis ipaensis]|uniref:DNA topoisomerase 2 isoform X1 n=1 Tax=Arachis ipaensis TaxID=130454 RepID=UPI0007AFC1BC|nr:DNA topoisomerase 2 isoform X1 [Arachis ipaensis]
METQKKRPLHTSTAVNIPASTAPASGKTIEEMYQKKTQLEHILLRPDTYVGSIEKHTQTLWVYNDINNEMVYRPVTYVPGLYKIFDEILVNAADNKQRDPSMDSLKVVIDPERGLISVFNNGDGVPVEIHQEEKVYVPELIFGHLLTSSNYDDNVKKTTGGRNGYGAKLTNIFSTEFVIETADGKRQKKYKQVFSDNMGKKSDPVITKCKEGENWTKVTFKPDLEKFKMAELEEDVVVLMKKRVVDMAGCLGKTVKVELNGKAIKLKSFRDYADLYLKSAEKSKPAPLPRSFAKIGDRWEICVSLSDGQFQQVSFVNSIATIKGGTHVDYITNQITSYVMSKVNKKKKDANVKAHNVKNHLWVFVNALIDNPAFDSQTKETLTTRQASFGSKCDVPESMLKEVSNSGIVDILLSWADFKQSKDLKKSDGTKTQRIRGIVKLEDANEAGGRNSDKCTLILTEGDSAKALAMAGLSVVGRDHYGVFPLRGKLLNVREASSKQILENEEIQNIKKILGLQQNKEYSSVKSLRYGHLMIMADQDYDGSHIKGLLINFIHSFWPSLLKVPSFMVEFTTPIIRVSIIKYLSLYTILLNFLFNIILIHFFCLSTQAFHSNGTKLSFYSMPEYESWRENLGNNATGWKIKYYKGLGTSTPQEGREYFRDLDKHRKDFVWDDDQDGSAIELAFSKKKTEDRKTWIRNFEPGTCRDHMMKHINYRDFVNKELILFSRADLQRSIPSMVDGLKPGQRKILFCSFKKKLFKEIKVGQFIGYVSEHSAYHHGEQSLASTIIGMAQDFVGSNNINLLKPNGQFGTRNLGGKDHASARYIYTELNPITRCLFHEDDDKLLEYLNEDGRSIEPSWYIPIIPLVLVNGSEGIGTGWSSYIPNYNPREVIANVRRMLSGEAMLPMDPWYRGFHGVIEKSAKEGGYIVNGMTEEIDEQVFRITELPIRRWTQDYKQFLESVTDGSPNVKDPLIEDFRQNGDDAIVDIEVRLKLDKIAMIMQEGLLKKFKLTSTISTSNMHLFDAEGKIKKYDTPEQVLEEFFPLRLEYYGRRKQHILNNLERLLLILDNKVRFILGVVNGEIIVSNRKKADLLMELQQKGFTPMPRKGKSAEPQVAGANDDISEEQDDDTTREETATVEGAKRGDYEYLLSLPIGTLTIESVQKLLAEKDEKEKEFEILKATPPTSMWMKDLDELEKKLDEMDSKAAEEQQKRSSQGNRKTSNRGISAAAAAKKPPQPRKNTKKATKAEPENDNSSMEIENHVEVAKPKGRPKKAPAKKVVDEDEILSLQERLAAYNFGASSDQSSAAMEAEAPPEAPAARKGKTGRAKKKSSSTILLDSSDSDNVEDEDDGDDDFEILDQAASEAGKKKGGRKPAAHKAAKAPAATKRNLGSKRSQKLSTEMLKPAEEETSPEKKVRRMRPSPFNKKSGSLLGRLAEKDQNASEGSASANSPSTTEEEVVEVAPVAARARPQRANRTQARYVVSESESNDDDDGDDKDDSADEHASDFSDFEDED